MELIRNIDADPVKRTIVGHTLKMLDQLNIAPLCEGVETAGELETLQALGVKFIQGYLFAKPTVAALATPHWPENLPRASAA